jgi:MFS family permease
MSRRSVTMEGMPSLGKSVGYGVKSARVTARGGQRAGRWVTRRVGFARKKGGGGEVGMMRLLDLHAVSCAGDTLVTMGLAGTAFFRAQDPGAARSQVGLYLLLTMAPFALIAPIVGPVLDRFRHGRRIALAVTMFGRAFLAWVISDYIHGFGLYPAALGVLVLSRAYGVARSAAVPRLLPATLRLSEAGARASVFGTVAGLIAAPIGALAFTVGPQWALRVAALVFMVGAVIALGLPPRADSDPPETVPSIFKRNGKALSGRLVFATLTGSAILRALYGFLALFLLFAVRSGHLSTHAFGINFGQGGSLALIIGSLGVGSFLATAVGTRLHIHRPALLQAGSLVVVTALGIFSLIRFDLVTLTLLCLGTATASQLAKLAVDATIQERIAERVRASAFAHSETVLMLAWVLGGGLGLVPFGAWWGVFLTVSVLALLTVRGVVVAAALRKEKLSGVASGDVPPVPIEPEPTTRQLAGRTRRMRSRLEKSTEIPTATKPLRVEEATTEAVATRVLPRDDTEPDSPGYHLYRPSGAPPTDEDDDD